MSSALKKRFEETVQSMIRPLAGMGVTPNHVTALGVLVACLTAWLYWTWGGDRLRLVAAAATLILSGLLDAVDGVLARSTGNASRFGGFLDSVADRYSDALAFSGLVLGGLCDAWVGLAALVGSLMVSYCRSRAEAEGVKMAGVGLAERAERMLLLAALSLASYWWLPALNVGVAALAALAHLTVVQRTLYFRKRVEGP
ncbi:MAG TPA: archaetidylinositol phosphate synthase [Candidatus Desulfaltia sp.]|nr:archaetidylinositol phosphate synthase [Candidatus Desulfaltia sp.]